MEETKQVTEEQVNQEQESFAPLAEFRFKNDGTMGVVYSDNLVYLLKSNSKEDVKNAMTDCLNVLLDNIVAGIEQVTKDAK